VSVFSVGNTLYAKGPLGLGQPALNFQLHPLLFGQDVGVNKAA
jgi:hypothetical protein